MEVFPKKRKIAKSKKVLWNSKEDELLLNYIKLYPKKWNEISELMKQQGILKSGKQCRERWLNRLDTSIDRNALSISEIIKIFNLYDLYGPSWSIITKMLGKKTENSIKNGFYSAMRKEIRRINQMFQSQNVLIPELDNFQVYALSKTLKCPVYEIHKNKCEKILEAINSLSNDNLEHYFNFILSKKQRKNIFKIEKNNFQCGQVNISFPASITTNEYILTTNKLESIPSKLLPELNELRNITDNMEKNLQLPSNSENLNQNEIKRCKSDFFNYSLLFSNQY